MTKVTLCMQIKEGMPLREVMKNDSEQQRDSNSDGKSTGDEVK